MLLMGFGELRRELPVAPLFRQTKEEPFYSLSMADAQGDDLAESLQSLFTNISSMVKSELQVNKRFKLLRIIVVCVIEYGGSFGIGNEQSDGSVGEDERESCGRVR